MGIAGLWAFLREEGHVSPLEGVELAKHVEGKVLAIDASLWLMQSQLEDSHTHDRRHIKVVFERVIHFLMMGALPVLVFEGTPPPAKQQELERRRKVMWGTSYSSSFSSRASVPRKNAAFEHIATDVKKLLDALGLPYEQAVGEGEAMCALLNRQGKVDAVVSNDGDALLYGVRAVYKDLRLHVRLLPDHHRGEWLDRENALGQSLSMSSQDFLALCLLSGCDFLMAGVKQVGCKSAMEVLRALKRRRAKQQQQQQQQQQQKHHHHHQSAAAAATETSLLDLLRTSLTKPIDEALVAPGGGLCSTCRTCRHGSTRKEAHGTKGCEECGTHTKTRGGDGKGGCLPAAKEDVEDGERMSCPCLPCQRRDERTLQMLAKRAAEGEGGLARYLRKFDEARAAYESAGATATVAAAAAAAEEEGKEEEEGTTTRHPHYRWHARPDFARLKDILGPVYGGGGYGRKNLARKLLPLLLEWDARQVGAFLGQNAGRDGAREVSKADLIFAAEHGFLFAPVRIDRVCLIGANAAAAAAAGEGGGGWRYKMEWVALCPQAEAMVAEAAEGMRGEGKGGKGGKGGEGGREDEEALPKLKEVLSEGRSCLRQSLVHVHFMGLLRLFEDLQRRKLEAPSRPKKKGASTKAGAAAAAAARAKVSPTSTLDRYFPLEKKKKAPFFSFSSPPRSQEEQEEQQQQEEQKKEQQGPFEIYDSPAAASAVSSSSSPFAASISADQMIAASAILARTRITTTTSSSSSSPRCPRAPRKGKRPGGSRVGEGVGSPGRTSGKRNLDHYFKRVRVDENERERESLSSSARLLLGMEEEGGGGEGGSQGQGQGNAVEDSSSSSSSGNGDEEKNDDEEVDGGGKAGEGWREEEEEESVIDLTEVSYVYSPAVASQQQQQQQQQQHVSSDDGNEDEEGSEDEDGSKDEVVIVSPEVERVRRAVACVDLVTPP